MESREERDAKPDRAQMSEAGRSAERPLASQQLLRDAPALWIDHNGALYCLRVTRQGRLILTK